MQFRKATKRLTPFLRNCLLVVCLIYIGGSWIMPPEHRIWMKWC